MALTIQDLKNIEGIITKSVDKTVERAVDKAVDRAVDRAVDKAVDRAVGKAIAQRGLASRSDLEALESRLGDRLESRMDRMESRLLFSMSLIERDGFDRLDDHERRIHKLEQIQTH